MNSVQALLWLLRPVYNVVCTAAVASNRRGGNFYSFFYSFFQDLPTFFGFFLFKIENQLFAPQHFDLS
jgi:hypothetical protein